jgi:hypothetical protein
VLPKEHFLGAMRAGMRFVAASPPMHAAILRACTFFFFTAALWALLPPVVGERLGLGPDAFGLMLAAMGLGSVATGLVLPRIGVGCGSVGGGGAAARGSGGSTRTSPTPSVGSRWMGESSTERLREAGRMTREDHATLARAAALHRGNGPSEAARHLAVAPEAG